MLLVALCSGWSVSSLAPLWICRSQHASAAALEMRSLSRQADGIMKAKLKQEAEAAIPEKQAKLKSVADKSAPVITDEEDEDDLELAEKKKGGRTLPCFSKSKRVYWKDNHYVALTALNSLVFIAEDRGEAGLEPIADKEISEGLWAKCVAACKEDGVELMKTPFMLTAKGQGLDYLDDDEELDDENDIIDLATVEHEEKKIVVALPLEIHNDGGYIIGKLVEGNRYVRATKTELKTVEPIVDLAVKQWEMAEVDDDDDDEYNYDDDDYYDDYDDYDEYEEYADELEATTKK